MKTILWETNFNGKLDCNSFVHIDLAPEKLPTTRQLEETAIRIEVADKSHVPVMAKLQSIIPFRVGELSNIHVWPSHGMDSADFINYQHQKKKIDKDTMLAVYYYQKVN